MWRGLPNGWTGGQYSIFRVLLGAYALCQFSVGLPTPSWPVSVTGALLSLALAVGWFDRIASVGLVALLALTGPRSIYPAWLLAAHALLPPAPYGSFAMRGRTDPGGGWRMPQAVYAAAWAVMALGYWHEAYLRLGSTSGWAAAALALAFPPLALSRRTRPWLWAVTLAVSITNPGLVLLHLFCWDPAWVLGSTVDTEVVYYDGLCGLCHRTVRFLLAEDRAKHFRFSPLQGERFARSVPETNRRTLPDSIVVATGDGRYLVRAAGILHVLDALGGIWRLLAIGVRIVPLALLDRLYDAIAAARHRVFERPVDACPVTPAYLRARFDP